MKGETFIVVCQQIVGGNGVPFETVYGFDGKTFTDRKSAIRHGFKIRGSDDFNIAVVCGRKVVSFDWMDKPIGEPPEVIAKITEQVFP